MSHQFGKLCQALGNLWNIFQLNKVFHFKHVHNSVPSDFPDNSFYPILGKIRSPLIIADFERDGVEDNAGYDF